MNKWGGVSKQYRSFKHRVWLSHSGIIDGIDIVTLSIIGDESWLR